MGLHRQTTYVPGIDGLRTLAVFAVLAYHCLPPVVRGGYLGVDVFFVISGFLTAAIVTRGGPIRWTDFYLRRVRRLFPLLLTVVSVLFLFLLITERQAYWLRDGLAVLTYTSNLAALAGEPPLWMVHSWSLSQEMQFYLLLPLLLGTVTRLMPNHRLAGFLLLYGMAMIYRMWCIQAGGDVRYYFDPISHGTGLLLGCALVFVPKPARGLETQCALALLCLLALMLLAVKDPVLVQIWLPLAELSTAVLIWCLVNGAGGRVSRLLEHKALVTLGLWSYGIYLWHFPISVALRSAADPFSTFVATAIISTGLAGLTYYLVEQRFHRRVWAGLISVPAPNPRAGDEAADQGA